MYIPVDHSIKECKWEDCIKWFKPKSSHQNFCSKSCYRKFGKKYLNHSDGNKKWIKGTLSSYRKHKKSKCEECGFIPVHLCQLDVDHVDGNHHNNEISNLKTLCANCHRLKTYLQRWT